MDYLVPNIGSIGKGLSAARSLRFPFRTLSTAVAGSILLPERVADGNTLITIQCRQA